VRIKDDLSGKRVELREPFRVRAAPAAAQPTRAQPPPTPPAQAPTPPTGR
jgi:hypothetical protein